MIPKDWDDETLKLAETFVDNKSKIAENVGLKKHFVSCVFHCVWFVSSVVNTCTEFLLPCFVASLILILISSFLCQLFTHFHCKIVSATKFKYCSSSGHV